MSSAPERPRECEHALDAAPYVLYALDDGEARVFGEHLASCATCREEVAQLRSTADALAVGVRRVEAPPGLAARVMGAVYSEVEPTGGSLPERAPSRAPSGEPRAWRRALAPALAATVALTAGLLIGALAINTPSRDHPEIIRAIVIAPGHRATADLRSLDGHVQLVVEGMPAPPAGRIYQIWLERGTQEPEPTDVLFSVTRTGEGTAAVPGGLRGISHVLVTDEPLGGSLKPTRKPIIVAKT